MPVLDSFHPTVTVDQILRWEGADPAAIHRRRPQLAQIAAQSLETGLPLLRPLVLLEEFAIVEIRHQTIRLAGDFVLSGSGLTSALVGAETLLAGIATIGADLEKESDRQMEADPVFGLALDGLANAALDDLLAQVCRRVDGHPGRYTSALLSPGMDGWPVEEGQSQLFHLLPAAEIGVRLTPSGWMLPRKSCSFVLGISTHPFARTSPCQVCGLKETCRYRKENAHA